MTIIEKLESFGVVFRLRSYWLRTGKTMPDEIDLTQLGSDEWDAEVVPTWPAKPDENNAAILHRLRHLFFNDEYFKDEIENEFFERQVDTTDV